MKLSHILLSISLISTWQGCGFGAGEPDAASSAGKGGADGGGAGGGDTGEAVCGNGVVESGEACDDGGANGQWGACRRDCQGPGERCGDGVVQRFHEVCDDGDANGTYGHCATDCQGWAGLCGDGEVQEEAEVCDDGGANGTYGHCATDCQGLGPRCGDGALQPEFEACDDGEANGTYDHCASDCRGPGPRCGDGVVQAGQGEACDDGDANGTYGHCTAACDWPSFPPKPYPLAAGPFSLDSPPRCTQHDWFAKYLAYRTRLRGDGTARNPGFVSVGPDPGQSLVASFREPGLDCARAWWMPSCRGESEDLPDAKGAYFWGDATVWLGEYIGVLATEYAVFQLLGMDTSETLEDLYFALAAFDRLDLTADTHFGVEPRLDGFFQRDDVPADFHLNPDGSYRFPRDDDPFLGYECVKSTASCGEMSIQDGSFESQDQAIGMMTGLTLVALLVPDGVQVRGEDVRHEARAQIHRIVHSLQSHSWHVTAPDGTSPPDRWGGNALAFSDLLGKVANRFCAPDFGVVDYRDDLSRGAGQAAFAGLLAIWGATHGYNRTMAFRLTAVVDQWDADTMARRTSEDDKIAFALAWSLFHGEPMGAAVSTWRIESLLDSAPCQGPCRDVPGCENTRRWMGPSMVHNPGSRIGDRHNNEKEFNGIDYMLLHNLYLLYRDGAYTFGRPGGRVAVDPSCPPSSGLERLLAGSARTYDPTDPCNAPDMQRRFCGRTWAAWLDAAFRREASIFLGGAPLRCGDGLVCELGEGGRGATDGIDLILGGAGPDEIYGRDGDDCIYGFEGDDHLEGGLGRDEIHGGPGADELFGEVDRLNLEGGGDTLWGEEGDDHLEGGPGRDELWCGPGDDTADGGSGDDYFLGEEGEDRLEGGGGDDVFDGGPGRDEIRCGAGDDVAWGGAGDDRIEGGGGDDRLSGGSGDDFVKGDGGKDSLVAGEGHDRLCGGNGDDVIWGNWDGDSCLGGSGLLAGDDELHGCRDEPASRDDCSDDAFDEWWEAEHP